MSSLHPLSPAQPSSSSSRKRSYAEITRSESRSQSPRPPSKRRRTLPSSSPIYRPARSASPLQSPSPPRRFVGDGFDYRRPVMASTNNDTDTIDLTLDDDSPPPTSRLSSESPEDYFPSPSPLRESAEIEQRTAPPFLAGNVAEPLEVIDLSDEEEEVAPRPVQRTRAVPVRSSSPDIEFIHERPAQAALARPDPPVQPAVRREPWHPPQPPAFHRAINFVRQNTQNIFGNFQPHLSFFPAMAPVVHDGGGAPVDEGDGLGAINFNYEQAAFQVGNRDSEPPQAMHSPYKAPPAPLDGCTRTYEEESILICPSCSNELASGGKDENDLQRQVWVNKACGHVYCGTCAKGRHLTKHHNNKEKRKVKQGKALDFRTCLVEGCKKPTTNKQGMFQVYL